MAPLGHDVADYFHQNGPVDTEFATERGPRILWELWIMVWHALKESQEVLGQAMPKREQAEKITAKLEEQITAACDRLRLRNDLTEEPYGIRYWDACRQ